MRGALLGYVLAGAAVLSGCAAHAPAQRHLAVIGDTVSAGWPIRPGFPFIVSRNLDASLQDLTALKSPPNFSVQQALQTEVPAVAEGTTDAIVALGAYDLEAQAQGFLTTVAVQDANIAIIQALLARNIHVYELTVRDYSRDPRWKRGPMPIWRANKLPILARMYNNFVTSTPGVTVIDIRRYPALMNTRSYYTKDGMHLTPEGQQAYAQVISDVIKGNSTRS